jgi:predicted N-acetyltransferase YhbS
MMRIAYLADHPDLAPALAAWHHREWADLYPGWTAAEAEAELRSHTRRAAVPTTLVALAGGRLIGSASLLVADLAGWEHLSPWVASVYVDLAWRGRGVGTALVRRAVEVAGELGVPAVYLFTPGQEAFYERMGWSLLRRGEHHGRAISILTRSTGDTT